MPPTKNKPKAPRKKKNAANSVRRSRRVFIIGAGVSASCGIAVAKDILRESLVRLDHRDSAKANTVHKLLKYLYPSFQQKLLNYPNIEDFLNLTEMARRFNSEEFIKSNLWSEPKIEGVQRTTLKAVTDYIWDLMQQKHALQVIKDFVRDHVRPGDTIITFNWDLTLERAIWDDPQSLSFWYSYPDTSDEDSVVLLKPHGSIDWFNKSDLPKATRVKGKVQSLDESVCVFTRFNFSDLPEMANYTPVIVPPLATKEFSQMVLKRTWRGVYKAVSQATSLNILGYSLPREDQFARLVLGRALRSNRLKIEKKSKRPLDVAVVNPDETAETTFRRLVGPGVRRFTFYQATFQNFVAGSHDQPED
jgi:SIR2-like domain